MSTPSIGENVSEMIWTDYDDRLSNDEKITFTDFMREAHEVALQLLSEFPEINLSEGEYLLEDDEENGAEIIMAGLTGRWKSYSVRADGSFILQRPYDEEANDLIVARDFPDVIAMQAFIEEERQEAIHQEFREMTSAIGPKVTGWYRQRSDTNIHKIGIVFDGLDLVPDDSREFDTEEEAVIFLKEWQTEMAANPAILDQAVADQAWNSFREERRRRAVD